MSLKLVTDNTNVVTIGGLGLADEIRDLASEIGNAASAVVIMDGHPIRVLGDPLSDHALIGIFEAAKFDVMRDLLNDD